ncbi:MAG: TM1812 family CRISPR-associated protein, partial [Candidatus Nezhaarchaeales archaeon]
MAFAPRVDRTSLNRTGCSLARVRVVLLFTFRLLENIRGFCVNCGEECYLVLASWGQPYNWNNVTYTIGSIKLESCSPLPVLLLHIASERGSSIKRVYLMGLDSVVDVPETTSRQVESICGKAFLECRGRCKSPSNWSSYTELAEYAEELYKCILGELLSNTGQRFTHPALSGLINSITTLVLPATGSPGRRMVFRGNPEDYLSIALLKIGRDLVSSRDLFEKCSSIVVVLDVTHGINYAAALSMRIAEITAEILRLLYNKPVKLEIYNSDPVQAGRTGAVTRINKVYEKRITEIEVPPLDELKLFNPALIEKPCLDTVEK